MLEKTKEYIIRRLIGMSNYETNILRYDNIEDVNRWIKIYEGNPEWAEETRVTNVATSIVSSFAKKATIEMESRVVSANEETESEKADYINTQYKRLVDKTRVNVEHLLVQGGALLRPYVTNGKIITEFISPDRFIPIRFNEEGDLVEVIIIDRLKKDNRVFTKLETHVLKDDGDYSIIHTFHLGDGITSDGKISNEIPSSLVPDEWGEFEEEFYAKGVEFPFFVYMRNPVANNKDITSPLGVSIYSQVEGKLRDYDTLYDIYMWEFEGGELKIFGSRDFIRQADPSLQGAQGTFEKLSHKLSKRMERLYISLDMKPRDLNNPLEVFNPDLREEEINAAMDKLLRGIEFDVGFGYGELSNVEQREKTAEEVRAGKQRTHTTVVDIQKEIERAYRRIIDIMEILVNLGGYKTLVPKDSVNDKIEVTFYFDDSIVVNREEKFKSMVEDVKLGIISKQKYIMEKYGLSESEAEEMVKQVNSEN